MMLSTCKGKETQNNDVIRAVHVVEAWGMWQEAKFERKMIQWMKRMA